MPRRDSPCGFNLFSLAFPGASGANTFYGCSSLVGGNGTAYSSAKVSYKYFVIDSDDAEGYLTAG